MVIYKGLKYKHKDGIFSSKRAVRKGFFVMKIGVMVESFRLGFRAGVEKAASLGAAGIQAYATGGELGYATMTPEKAKEALDNIGVIAKITDVIAVYLDDKTGGLAKVLKILTNEKISVEYMYAFLSRQADKALMVLKADDEPRAEKVLKLNGIEIFDQKEM